MHRKQGKDAAFLGTFSLIRKLAGKPEVFLFTLLLLAAILRFYRLDEIPPGLNRDEAYNGLDALRVLQRGTFPLFFEANEGREPLFIYLQTIGVALLGVRAWALRLVSTFVGLATLPLLFRVGAELFSGEKRARWLGVVAASGLAVSYWHLHASRMGFRAVLLPPLSILTIWFFWRGWQWGHTRDWILGGIGLGAALYTYSAARFLPLVIIAFVLVQWVLVLGQKVRNSPGRLTDRALSSKEICRGLLLLGLAALAVAAPLAIYFIRDPYSFSGHASSLSIYSPFGPASPDHGFWRLQQNAINVVRMFIDRGDEFANNNLPNRPALDWFGALGFWVGILMAALRPRRPEGSLLLLWLVVMLLPTVLSSDAPNYLRAVGALPPMLLLAANGFTSLWERLAGRIGWQPLAISIIMVSGLLTVHDYFFVWASLPDTFREFDDGFLTSANRALELVNDYDVAVPVELYARPENQLLFMSRFGSPVAITSPLRTSRRLVYVTNGNRPVGSHIVLLHGGDQVKIMFPGLLDAPTVKSWQEQLDSPNSTPIVSRSGAKVGNMIQPKLADQLWKPLAPTRSYDATFGEQIHLVGYDLAQQRVKPDETAEFVLYWQALKDLQQAYINYVRLQDAKGEVWDHYDREVKLTTDVWRRGQITPDILRVHVPAGAPPGKYMLALQVLRGRSDIPLPVFTSGMSSISEDVTLGPLTVGLPSPPDTPEVQLQNIHFGDPSLISLLGYNLGEASVSPGGVILIQLVWKSERKIEVDYTVFVHLLDSQGRLVAQHDAQPQEGNAPTSLWFPQEIVLDRHQLRWPVDLPQGEYSFEIGLYDLKTGRRLPAFSSAARRLTNDCLLLDQRITLADRP